MLLVFSVLLVVSCSSSSEPTEIPSVLPTVFLDAGVTPTVNVPPDVVETVSSGTTATPEPTKTPTATATPVIELDELDIDDVLVANCRITGELKSSGFSGMGTAPGPTPTASPPRSERQPETVVLEASVFSQYLHPIIRSLSNSDNAFETGWRHARSVQAQAGQLHVYGNRLAQLCSAISQLSIPVEFVNTTIGLSEAIRAKHAWVLVALAELKCCGDAQVASMDSGREMTSKAIQDSTEASLKLFGRYLNGGSTLEGRRITSDRFGLAVNLPESAIVVRNTIDVLVIGSQSPEILDTDSLGPTPWIDGAGVRIRRVRNRTGFSVDQAAVEHAGTIGRYGELTDSEYAPLNGLDSIRYNYDLADSSWRGASLVFVLGDFTYVVESMCQPAVDDQCESIEQIVDSIDIQHSD